MIRKMLVIAAAVAMPAAGFAAVTAVTGAGIASAKTTPPPLTTGTCAIGGSLAFNTPGITQYGTAVKIKSTSTTVTMTSSGTGACAASTTSVITQKAVKCKVITYVPIVVSGITLDPSSNLLNDCTGTGAKGDLYGSAWAFGGGEDVSGVSSPATAGILTALKKGVAYNDNGTTVTLIPTVATQITPGGVCGSEAGFALSGTIKKQSDTWALNLCLGSDSGTGTTGSFIGDVSAILLNSSTADPAVNTTVIASAGIDDLTSTLTISA